MAKTQRIFQSLMLLVLLMGFGAALPNAAMPDAAYPAAPTAAAFVGGPRLQDIPDAFELVAENADFQLYVDEATLAFKVVDKRSGYIWHSNLDEVGEDDRLNRTWTAFAQSGVSIDYLDQKATRIRASITNTNHAIEVKPISQGFEATVQFLDPSITMVVQVQLEPDGVRVQVPFASIKEEDLNFKLGLLHVYPFFGATREDSVPGYMFIPDGAGTLIRFAAQTKAKNMFYGRYYGTDLGMISTLPYDPTINRPYKISIPVTGMVHGEKQHAYLAIVEKGAPYGEIQAHPAGIITNFNFLYNTFIYNESYFQATNRAGAGVTTLQPSTNRFDVSIHYRFLTGDDSDYVGMANSYQAYLVEKGSLPDISTPDGDIGIRLEFLGSEKEKVLFWHRSIPMTTVAQMSDILAELAVENPEVVYYGWQPLGASTMPPRSLRLDRKLGNLGQLDSLIETVSSEGGNFYFYLDPQAALWDERGYSTRRDLAMSITNSNLVGYNRNKVNYFLNNDALSNRYTSLSADVSAELQAGLALDGVGSMLYSDFKRNHFLNREEAIQQYQALLAENNINLAFYMPNDYLFGFMQAYFDIPLTNSGYLYTTESVPFLQIVLAGHVPYYGPALNFSSNTRQDLLRHVDFGAYPSYFLTEEITAKILNTRSNWIYTSSYAQWGQEIEQNFQWLNSLLGPVTGQRIVARQMLAAGVFATTYDNGKQIIVNYNNTPFAGDGVVVNSQDAVIREAQP
ncbi:MAG TPA: DUF5696 domain-containing protein [Chloroflexota bacterium]|nr:DUF5696 domain-containing protein [Chloroflexota bacterium]